MTGANAPPVLAHPRHDLALAHRRIDADRVVAHVEEEVGPVVVRRHAPRADAHRMRGYRASVRERAAASTAPAIGIEQGRPAILGSRHMVSSSHYLSTLAGLRMFPRGGSAIDAGIAAGIALNVLERHLTDFGGVA